MAIKMVRLLVGLWLLLGVVNVQAGGDLPFPFGDDEPLPIASEKHWNIIGTEATLGVALKLDVVLYQPDPNTQLVRLWLRGADNYLWDTTWITRFSDTSSLPIEYTEGDGTVTRGLVVIDWRSPVQAMIWLKGTSYKLSPLGAK